MFNKDNKPTKDDFPIEAIGYTDELDDGVIGWRYGDFFMCDINNKIYENIILDEYSDLTITRAIIKNSEIKQ